MFKCSSYNSHIIQRLPALLSNITCIRTPTQRAWLARIGVGGGILVGRRNTLLKKLVAFQNLFMVDKYVSEINLLSKKNIFSIAH
jgi:hypothetical protein